MNPIQLIKQDHRTVKALFRRFEKADRSAEKQKLGQEIIEELSIHTAMEEMLIYPLLKARGPQLEDPILNALEEHHAVKLVLAELDKMNADEERYDAKMHVVRESVEMHIEEEESKLLPRLDTLDAEDRRNLASAMLQMKEDAPNYPHPHVPDTPPGAVIAAMLAKMTDSGKDLVRRITSSDKAAGHRRVKRRASRTASKTQRKRARSTARKPRSSRARSARGSGGR